LQIFIFSDGEREDAQRALKVCAGGCNLRCMFVLQKYRSHKTQDYL